ncbi:MAG: hypothetical protein K2M76_06710, partial [Muribaculaceae bacterium]|nr:hypothetical protein [Muribaculaceae bacterium]
MDVRDTATGHALDPMPYFKNIVADNVAPQMRQIALYPMPGAKVNGSTQPAYISPADKGGRIFTAWGNVIPGIKAYDRMTGTTNIYGVKHLSLRVDGHEVYRHTIDRVDLNRSRAINSMICYPDKQRRGSWVMTSRIADNDQLDYMRSAENKGILNIDQERDYRCEWIMTDEHGNRATVPFTIRGQRTAVSPDKPRGTLFRHNRPSHVSGYGLDARFPADIFYNDFYFNTTYRNDSSYHSRVYTVGDETVPLAGNYTLTIDLTSDDIADKSKYCMVRINGKSKSALTSTYTDGHVSASPNCFGIYAVTIDTIAPAVTPVSMKNWGKNGTVSYRLTDNLSGINRYYGTIDGEFVLFELDGKTARASYKLEPERVKRGQNHTITMTATDACGNTTTVTDRFYW